MKRNFIYHILLSTALLAIMTGCVTTKYQRPELPNISQYRGNTSPDTATIARMEWRQFFTDTHLIALIDEAFGGNFDLAVALERINESRSYYRQSKAAFYPTFGGQIEGSMSRPSEHSNSYSPLMSNPLRDIQLGFSASWEADIWGKLSSANRAELANLLGQEASKNAVITRLVSDLASAYYQLLALDFKRDVTQHTIVNRSEYLETVRLLKESGKVNEVAVQQAEAQLKGAEAYIPEFDQAIFITENYISLLLGRTAGEIERSEGMTLEHLEFIEQSNFSVGVPAQLLQYRPDLQVAEYALRAAHESVNIAKASMYPSLTISGALGADASTFNKWFSLPQSIMWNAVAGITQPIWNGRKLRTQKEVAESRRIESLLQFKKTLISAQNEVSNALMTNRLQGEKAIFQLYQYQALAKAYSYSIDLFVNGYATYLDVLTAQDGVFNTRLSLIDTYLNKASAQIDLYCSLGGGWDYTEVTKAEMVQDRKDRRGR